MLVTMIIKAYLIRITFKFIIKLKIDKIFNYKASNDN